MVVDNLPATLLQSILAKVPGQVIQIKGLVEPNIETISVEIVKIVSIHLRTIATNCYFSIIFPGVYLLSVLVIMNKLFVCLR